MSADLEDQPPAPAAPPPPPPKTYTLVDLDGKRSGHTIVDIEKIPGQSLGIHLRDTFLTRDVVVEEAPDGYDLCRGDVIKFINGMEAIDAPQVANLIMEGSAVRLAVKTGGRMHAGSCGTDVAAFCAAASSRPVRIAALVCGLCFLLPVVLLALRSSSSATQAKAEVTSLKAEHQTLRSRLSVEQRSHLATLHRANATATKNQMLYSDAVSRLQTLEMNNATLVQDTSRLRTELREALEQVEKARLEAKSLREKHSGEMSHVVGDLNKIATTASRRNQTLRKHISHDSHVQETLKKLQQLEVATKDLLSGALTELSTSAKETEPSPPPSAPPPPPSHMRPLSAQEAARQRAAGLAALAKVKADNAKARAAGPRMTTAPPAKPAPSSKPAPPSAGTKGRRQRRE